ncbi:mavicyanin-like [Oryza brachyantha]|uniref:Phytocyanin domain-containing protein n=1 Tax=Oryza brachyantha TaxID=4533 RepID=J3M033_ORYBR|nr:mavicyanin-like [Oryza brachyantha]
MAGPLPGVLAAVLLVVAAAAPASAKDYTVGDSSGWVPGVDYTAWAKGKKFSIGDTLLFQYNGRAHSVVEVSAADLSLCSASNPLRSYKSDDGITTITLTKPGARYFICGATGHCASGMKLTVTVESLSGGGSSSSSSSGARPVKPGEEAPSDVEPAAAGTTTARTSSTTSSATGSRVRTAAWLLFFAAASFALIG